MLLMDKFLSLCEEDGLISFGDEGERASTEKIQSAIEELVETKKELVTKARAVAFDGDPERSREGNKSKSKDLNRVGASFDQPSFGDEPTSSKFPVISHSDSSDDEFMDSKKDLNEMGKQLQKQLDKQEQQRLASHERQRPPLRVKKTPAETVLSGVGKSGKSEKVAPTLFDSFFRLNIRNPKISSSTFESYIDGHKRFRISDLKPNFATTGESWTTAGVVVSREVRKSANGKDYLIWKLHDLKDCQQPPVMLLLFGEAYKEYWKLQVGICVALMTPMIADQDNNPAPTSEKFKQRTTRVVLKVFRPVQVVELGYSSDLGMCKGVKLDGQKCSNFVNISLSDYCVHHVMKEARKLSANRGSFNSVTSHPPPQNPNRRLCSNLNRAGPSGIGSLDSLNSLGIIRPTQSNMIKSSELKTTTKSEEKETLKKIMNGQSHMFGARNLKQLSDSKNKGSGERAVKPGSSSMADFIHSQVDCSEGASFHAPKLGFGLCDEKDSSRHMITLEESNFSQKDPARLRAISILKKTKEQPSGKSRPAKRQKENLDEAASAKRSKLSTLDNVIDLDALLEKKSMYESEADKAQGMMVQKHLDSLEAKEKVETFVTECMSVKDVKVVNCKKCGYTAQRQSDLCIHEGHTVTRTTAEKRFFKCGSCHKRIIVFSMMPTKPCKQCSANEWVRVAMRDERKVQLENEKLLLRGEERKFVNS
ncbi:hypothetical protein V3C99_004674 [Haemonchus contortus]